MSDNQAAEAEAALMVALARAVAHLYANAIGQSAPDALRARIGAEDALLVMAAAGADASAIAARWSAAVPARSAQPQHSNIFADDPRHDPRYVRAQVTPGGSPREALREIALDVTVTPLMAQRAEVALGHIGRGMSVPDALDAAEIELARARYARQGAVSPPMGVRAGPDGTPVQSSAVRASVPALGQEVP